MSRRRAAETRECRAVQLGLMNSPAAPLADELRHIAAARFEFVDLTLEPPGAWPVDLAAVRDQLEGLGLAVVGHTPYYLPVASPFEGLRTEVRRTFAEQFAAFAALGARVVNVHPDAITPMFSLGDVRARNADAIAVLAADAADHGVRVMVENLGRSFSRVEDLEPIFERVPAAGFHLDVGHAHMARARGEPNRTAALIDAFGDRLAHLHVHDNVGVDDLHLPLGAGSVPWTEIVAALKAVGYDGTVTFEVFDTPFEYVDASRRLWLDWWNASEGRGRGEP